MSKGASDNRGAENTENQDLVGDAPPYSRAMGVRGQQLWRAPQWQSRSATGGFKFFFFFFFY